MHFCLWTWLHADYTILLFTNAVIIQFSFYFFEKIIKENVIFKILKSKLWQNTNIASRMSSKFLERTKSRDNSIVSLEVPTPAFKVKKSMLFVEKKYKTLIKMKRTRKWKVPRTLLQRRTLRLKSKTDGWKLADEKRRVFFVPLILSEGKFF